MVPIGRITAASVEDSLGLSAASGKPEQGFRDLLAASLNEVNRLQLDAEDKTRQLISGEDIELHQVMLAAEKASLALELTQTLRNKVIEAYQEIMRMQV
ncbi:MAG: flagellar hook-basal body complex protein FliE [Firmicutes bacterium]|jgi:flagellar hook-basal body complex protein FliE|nr:flagellar hook-basal body complex protein FliE [Bacillota bacterium]